VRLPTAAAAVAAAAAPLALALAGCGGQNTPAAAPTTPASGTSLTVTAWPNGTADESLTWTLTCHPTGGSHPDPETACAVLDAVELPFRTVIERAGCEEIRGGDEVVRVEGTLRGKPVDATFRRTDLCAMDAWDRVEGIFPLEPA
jgi:hypothetical protein